MTVEWRSGLEYLIRAAFRPDTHAEVKRGCDAKNKPKILDSTDLLGCMLMYNNSLITKLSDFICLKWIRETSHRKLNEFSKIGKLMTKSERLLLWVESLRIC